MRATQYAVKCKDVTTLVWTGDWHLGDPTCVPKCVEACMTRIVDRKLPWIHGGDACEMITPKDKRSDVQVIQEGGTVLSQISQAVEWIKAGRKTCIGLIGGNHEDTVSKEIGDVSQKIASDAGVPYLTQTAFVRLELPKGKCDVFITHFIPGLHYKAGSPDRIAANQAIRLRDLTRKFYADLKLAAHIHKFICAAPTYEQCLYLEQSGKVQDAPKSYNPFWHVVCPSMKRTYIETRNWAQGRLCNPTNIGWAEIDIRADGQIQEVRHVGADGKTVETVKPFVLM